MTFQKIWFLELHIGANNATCRLFKEFARTRKTTNGQETTGKETSGPRLFFVHVNVDTLFTDDSIQNLHQNGKLRSGGEVGGKHAIVHYRYHFLIGKISSA